MSLTQVLSNQIKLFLGDITNRCDPFTRLRLSPALAQPAILTHPRTSLLEHLVHVAHFRHGDEDWYIRPLRRTSSVDSFELRAFDLIWLGPALYISSTLFLLTSSIWQLLYSSSSRASFILILIVIIVIFIESFFLVVSRFNHCSFVVGRRSC